MFELQIRRLHFYSPTPYNLSQCNVQKNSSGVILIVQYNSLMTNLTEKKCFHGVMILVEWPTGQFFGRISTSNIKEHFLGLPGLRNQCCGDQFWSHFIISGRYCITKNTQKKTHTHKKKIKLIKKQLFRARKVVFLSERLFRYKPPIQQPQHQFSVPLGSNSKEITRDFLCCNKIL